MASDKAPLRAMIRFHQALARAHGEYASSLAEGFDEDVVELPVLRGHIQKRIAALSDLATIEGMTAGQISKRLDYDEANTYTALAGLEKADMVEVIENSTPRRWRLTTQHRRDRVLRLSRLIPEGRWTTYGEFAIAVYGNLRMARTIGRVASKNPAFAHPHRVLKQGGAIDPKWRGEGGGPEECKRRLTEEKVWLEDEDKANPKRFLDWRKLEAMLKAAEAEDEPEEDAA